ncbi:hypothetical protein GA0070606_0059 [Micromonospora citrea]|uniref:Uncharacterized protein n=1 Tax=Micromonospora citrea TaxID=47855 RepID=A0A1C6TQ10_9ACTN|nr:hypothetical protein [Micromonospora citrea]SCL43867.1 hypothetical protein GA0070606_0059 [Micromonospora citrea]
MSRARYEQLQQDATRRRHAAEDQVLKAAGELRTEDDSITARIVRETAQDIRDHRSR